MRSTAGLAKETQLLLRYGAAVACSVAVLAATQALEGLFQGALFSIPITVAALMTLALGAGPGWVFVTVTGVGFWFFFQPLENSFVLANNREVARLIAYFIASFTVVTTTELLHRTRRRLSTVTAETERALTEQRHVSEELSRDMTDLERAQKTLREERDFIAAVLDTVGSLIVVLDREGRIVRFNKACEAATGLSAHEAEGQPYERLIPAEEREAVRGVFEGLRMGDFPNQHENHWVGKDGTRRLIAWSNTAIPDETGRVRFIIGTGFDITERRRAEEELRGTTEHLERANEELARSRDTLRQSEARFRQLADAMPQVVWTARPDGTVDYYNERVHELSGARYVDGNWLWEAVLHPDDVQPTVEAWAHAVRTGQRYEIAHRVRRADGTLHWYLSRAVPVRDAAGRIIRWYGTATDIDAQKRAEQSARESQQLLRTTMDNFPTVIAFKDREGRFLDVNRVVETVLGLPKERICGRRVDDFIPAEAADVLRQHDLEVMEARQAMQFEETTPLPSGTLYHLNTNFPLIDSEGNVYGTGHISHDITQVKQAEQRLRALNEQLQEMDRRKNEFLAVLSHELRNPLAPIRNSIYILERATPGGEQARRALQVIDRQAQHMARLIDDLLDVTRISRGKITLQRERVDLNALARGTAEDHRGVYSRNGVELEVEGAREPLWVDGDRTRLAQVIGNLLNNAAKFTPRGGRTVLVVESNAQGEALVRVRDNGAGMSPETLEQVFEPFVQAAQTLERSRGGLGLGLALVKGLVEMHGGRITVRSEGEGKGSEFIVTLPLQSPATPRLSVVPVLERSPSARRVLVIEDNVDAAESLSEALELGDHEVAIAYSGPEGVETARKYRPDVIFCDIGLPGMDGYEVVRALRADPDPQLRSAFMVALSGYALGEDIRKSKEAGFDRHMAKPASIEALEKLLQEVSDRATAQPEVTRVGH
jgi:PAS domain S-box-containing protein